MPGSDDAFPLNDAINFYFRYLANQRAAILQLADRLHRKILLMTLVAALAEGRYDGEAPDWKKFVDLVAGYGGWPEGARVSVVQLKLYCEGKGWGRYSPEFRERVDALHQRADQGLAGNEVRIIETDPLPAELAIEGLSDPERTAIDKATHYRLLYQYRSTLVHEFRESGAGFELDDHQHPYYMPTIHVDGSRSAELTYPLGLIDRIVGSILDLLPAWYRQEAIAPFDQYRLGSRWNYR